MSSSASTAAPDAAAAAAVEVKKWNIVYPIYLNSNKTVQAGRRLPKSQSCEDPTALELCEICRAIGLPFKFEHQKAYSRDFLERGRVRIQLKMEDGAFSHAEVHTKKDFMKRAAKMIPELKSRMNRAQAKITAVETAASKKAKKEKKK
jgi:signal recognition particle subunit SRP19